VTWRRQLVNQKGEVVQQGVFVTLVAKSPSTPRRGAASSTTGRPARQSPTRKKVVPRKK
jgi:hypothetical protein